MKNISRILLKIIILVIILQFFILTNSSQASFWSDIFSVGQDFLEQGKTEATNTDPNSPGTGATDEAVMGIVNDIYSILFVLGTAIVVIIGGVLGIQYMTSSAEGKAKIKESMTPYVAGSIAIFGAFGIWKICIQIFSALS